LAARSRRLIALDQAVTEIRDDEQFIRDAEFGRDLGYNGKICVHPRQVEIANRVFSPSDRELEHSRRLIATYEAAMAAGKGTIDFEGKMIDGPLLKRAEDIVAMAEAIARREAAGR
jgi:citrate lyase subunit beta/citryl-CoA lyase